jgi:hypothetical protein
MRSVPLLPLALKGGGMTGWLPRDSDLKRYPHFDRHIPLAAVHALVTDPERVAANPFYPFMRYVREWQPFRHKDAPKKKKERPIRYASRRDAYIFAYYRYLLSVQYEAVLKQMGLEHVPIAYRRIPVGNDAGRGKCNIHFAKDAFETIEKLGECCAVALDISSFFESIDHSRLKSVWLRLLGKTHLPPDHFAVFQAITRYAYVDREAVYERVGYDPSNRHGASKGKLQICSPQDFRVKVCGSTGEFPSLINVNNLPYGIPQGAPISDLLANAYLIDFDAALWNYVRDRGGWYVRYSDDILIILPGGAAEGLAAKAFAMGLILNFGDKLAIKDEKTSIVEFAPSPSGLTFRPVQGASANGGLEYLGFRFDGRRVYLRNSTVSRFNRKITFAARREADRFVARYMGKPLSFLVDKFDYEAFIAKFGRVEDFDESRDCKDWTFWTYVTNAAKVFGPKGERILRQVVNHRKIIRRRIEDELARALRRRSKSESIRWKSGVVGSAPELGTFGVGGPSGIAHAHEA